MLRNLVRLAFLRKPKCAEPGCERLIAYGNFCEVHAVERTQLAADGNGE